MQMRFFDDDRWLVQVRISPLSYNLNKQFESLSDSIDYARIHYDCKVDVICYLHLHLRSIVVIDLMDDSALTCLLLQH